jgi:hypothetical protein
MQLSANTHLRGRARFAPNAARNDLLLPRFHSATPPEASDCPVRPCLTPGSLAHARSRGHHISFPLSHWRPRAPRQGRRFSDDIEGVDQQAPQLSSSYCSQGRTAQLHQLCDAFAPCWMWRPHSLLSSRSHHQRPARSGSPAMIARVHGAQPIDTNP